jgi:hypothetical protein
MKNVLALTILCATVLLVAAGWFVSAHATGFNVRSRDADASTRAMTFGSQETPQKATEYLLRSVAARDWEKAHAELANANDVNLSAFIYDLAGGDGSLRTYSTLEDFEVSVPHQTADEAMVRAKMNWSTAVGSISDTRDLKVVRNGSRWRVVWPVSQVPKVPAQVMAVNYLRWDVVTRGPEGDWGTAGIDPPKVRIISMNAIERGDEVIVMGEAVNEDIIPAYLNVNATLVGANGSDFNEEGSFDKVSHILLPSQVTPYRIDFLQTRLSQIKQVRMDAKVSAVPASADPVIGVMNQRLDTDALGRKILSGELQNQSGQTVNIAHVLATCYDDNGKIIWVSDGYVDHALLPTAPQPFAVDLPADIAARTKHFRVMANQYTMGAS